MNHNVEQISFIGSLMTMSIDGETHTFDLGKVSPRLAQAPQTVRETFEVSPSGYGIHWPLLDEDLSIDGLLGVTHKPKRGRLKMAA